MFLDIIKSFFIENRIKKSLSNSPVVDTKSIETIGILIDISEKNYSEKIKATLLQQQVDFSKTKTLVFKKQIAKDEQFGFDVISLKDFDITGHLKDEKAKSFVNYPFDLLICYFEDHQQALNDLAIQSKAKFKVGFKGEYNHYNNLFIETRFDLVDTFIDETFKYLKILNKR